MQIKGVIFDLDGTLVDTVPDVCRALNHQLNAYGLPEVSIDEMGQFMGHGARGMLGRVFEKYQKTLSEKEFNEAVNLYLTYYQQHAVIDTSIYPGVEEILMQLKQQGILLGVCTNKPALMARLVLKKLCLDRFFSVVLAGDEVKHPKPHAAHLDQVLKKMGLEVGVMVGDSEVDQACAHALGMPFIGVSYGYGLHAASDCMMINHFVELPITLEKIGNQYHAKNGKSLSIT